MAGFFALVLTGVLAEPLALMDKTALLLGQYTEEILAELLGLINEGVALLE